MATDTVDAASPSCASADGHRRLFPHFLSEQMSELGCQSRTLSGCDRTTPWSSIRSMHQRIHSIMALLKGSIPTTLEGDKQRPTWDEHHMTSTTGSGGRVGPRRR